MNAKLSAWIVQCISHLWRFGKDAELRRIPGIGLLFILLCLVIAPSAFAQQLVVTSLGDYGNVTVMEVTGNFDTNNPDGAVNAIPRQTLAREFYKTHKDEYDFLVIFTNFDFQMPVEKEGAARGFYSGVRNDTLGLGTRIFDNSSIYGSDGRLRGTIDMGNLSSKVSDPLDPKFEDTLSVLSHEMMHRWAAYVTFKDANGAIGNALLGHDSSHWSFLLDSSGSLMYGNVWQNNGNGTFTTTTPQGQMKSYSPLDLYLMGMIDMSQVPPMLLINSPTTDSTQLPQSGITVSGTAQYVTIDQIIAAMGPRVPDAATSQKNFKSAFILVTRPGTFTGNELPGMENIRNAGIIRYSILTDGKGIMEVASTRKDNIPFNPGVIVQPTTPRQIPPNIDDGAQWLMTNQKTDGSWSDLAQSTERDTAAAALILRSFTNAQTNYQSALLWLGGTSNGNMDFLSRKIQALNGSGADLTALINEVLSRQNPDGGWGSDRNYPSNPVDTALTLKALSTVGYAGQQIISLAVSYLKNIQHPDGGWGSPDKGSTIQETSNVLSAFNKYRASYPLEDMIARGTTMLVSKRNVDGGFGNSPSTVYDTSTAALTLVELNAAVDITGNAISYLQSRQSDNGSWNNSTFETALAVNAIYKGTIDPDLSIKPEDISFIPATISRLPANVVISANIWNQGRAAVPQARIALYEGDPASGNKIGEQVLSFAGQAPKTVSFSVPVNNNNGQFFTIVADPDNLVKESNKLNNKASKPVAYDATYDLQVLPTDITVSANPIDLFQDLKITSRITNNGTMNAYNVQVKYFIDDQVSPFDIATQTVDVPAGATITNEVTWRTNKAGIDLPLTILVDPFNVLTETSKTNNKASTLVTVNADNRPNLSVSYKDILINPTPADRGGSATISALVRNEGYLSANGIVVDIYDGVPGEDGVRIDTRTIPELASGASASVSITWQHIHAQGKRTIYVQVDPAGLISEIIKTDNNAFTTLVIRDLPDLVISQNSIVMSPAAPKEGDTVTITVSVQNAGAQTASNVLVRFVESGNVLYSKTIPAIAPNGTAVAFMTYDTTGKKGSHTIMVTADPDNNISEQTKDNNSASRVFGVQDSKLWVTEQYFSPNDDGVKDSTQLFFTLDTAQTVTVSVVNQKSEVVRTFSGPELANITAGNVTWDGLNNDGMVVPDGKYTLEVRDTSGKALGSLGVAVDTDRSSLSDALGTKYLLNNNLSCFLPSVDDSTWRWFPDDSGMLLLLPSDPNAPEYPYGLYTMAPDGQDIARIVPPDWTAGIDPTYDYAYVDYEISSNGANIAFILNKYNKITGITELRQLWVMDRDGRILSPPLDSYDDASGISILDLKWSPAGDYLAYRTEQTGVGQYLFTVKSDGTMKRQIDSGYSINFNNLRWSLDGAQLAYVITTSNTYIRTLRIADLSGNTHDVFGNHSFSKSNQYSLDWLKSQKLVLKEQHYAGEYLSHSIWLVDTSGNENHVNVSLLAQQQADISTNIIIAPDKGSFAFVENVRPWGGASASLAMKICDAEGNVATIRELVSADGNCVPQASSIVWSPDNKKVAFSEKIASLMGYQMFCENPIDPSVEVINAGTGAGMRYATDMLPFAWLADGVSLAGLGADGLCSLNADTGVTKCMPMPSNSWMPSEVNKYLSPREHYLTYYQSIDPSSICYQGGAKSGNLWAMSSLLNLTADVRALQNKSSIILKGIAADFNFDSYQLEYADVKDLTTWIPVAPPSDNPVINDIFTPWVPPYEGSFYVRLKVWDRGGNVAESRKRVSWGLASSITNLYKTPEIISPNRVGAKNAVELHYRVLESVHLEFNIFDDANTLIRTYYKDYTSPTIDYISWDGTDETGHTVPDGKYGIKVFDYEFFVEVDSTPPDAKISFSAISLDRDGMPVVSLFGHAYDKNIKSWSIEFGQGENPQAWASFLPGTGSFAAADANGAIMLPPQDLTVKPFAGDLGFLRGQKARITAQDLGGNIVTSISGFLDDRIFLAPDMLYQQGGHMLKRAVTTPYPIVEMVMQEKIAQQWTDVAVLQDPDASFLEFALGNINYALDPTGLRLRGVDVYSRGYVSNEISTAQTFSLSAGCGSGSVMVSLLEDLISLKLQIKGAGARQWTDLKIYTGSELASLLPNHGFIFPATASFVRIVALGESGRIYSSAPLVSPCGQSSGGGGGGEDSGGGGGNGGYGPFNPTLDITYSQGDCGHPLSGTATLSAHIGIPDSALRNLNYYLDNAQGEVLLKSFNLMNGHSGNAAVDTTALPEGRYPVKAVWEYYDASYQMLQEFSASGVLIVDRVPPAAQLTYPAGNSLKICPVITHTREKDQYNIPVEASITDGTAVGRYDLSYGFGQNPDTWYPVPISGNASVKGRIGTWDVSKQRADTYSLRLKASDVVGNVSCTYATFSYDAPVEIVKLLLDKKLISSNGTASVNTTTATYEIDKYATVDISAFKLLQTADSYHLDSTPVREIAAGLHHLGGLGGVEWNGTDDGGAAVPDGLYGITVHAVDGCGSIADKWFAVEVDGTSPDVAISYPKPGDPLGNIVEVKGSASDKHFQNYVLEAGPGENPDSWTSLSTVTSPVTDGILGAWNTFGLNDGAAPQRWTLRLSAWDNPGNKNVTTVLIDLGTRQSLIRSLRAAPALFSPNKHINLNTTTIQYDLTDTCDTKIEIIDANSVVRRTFSTSTIAAGLQTQPWDGTDDAGTALADGLYAIRLTAARSSAPDVNQTETITATIDTTPPAIDMNQPLDNAYVRNNITVIGSVTDSHLSEYAITLAGPAGAIQVDQGTQTRNSYAFGILNDLPDGAYALNIKSKDLGENTAEKDIVFTVDKTAPVVSLDALKNAGYYGGGNAVVDINGSMVEQNLNAFTLRYGLGDSPSQWTELMSGTTVPAVQPMFSWNVGPILDGVYTLSLFVTDKAGSTAEAKAKITIDNTAPTVSITAPVDGAIIIAATDITGTAFDKNLDKYTVEISAGQCADACQWAAIKTASTSAQNGLLTNWQALPPDGDYCIRVTAADKSGNTTQATVNVKVATHPPAAPVLSGMVMNKTAANLVWTTDNPSAPAGYNIYRNGQKINNAIVAAARYLDQNLGEGLYAYTVKAVDAFGLESKTSNEVDIKIDLTGPMARINSPQDGSRVSGLIDIKGTAFSADDFKQYRVSVGQGAAPTTWTTVRTSPVPVSYGILAPWDTLGLAEGQVYSVKLEAEDLSGNISTYQVGVTIDNTSPEAPHLISAVTITNSADSVDIALTWQPNIETDLAGYVLLRNDQLANVSGIVIGDLKPYLISVSTTTYLDKALPDGTFIYYVIAVDQAGNTSPTSNIIPVSIDTHPPHAAIVNPVDGTTIGSKTLIKATSRDLDIALVQFQYQSILSSPTTTTDWINLGSSVTSATIATYFDPSASGLSYDDYRLRAVATDKGNNTDQAPGFITVTYADLTPPNAPQGLSALTSGATVTLAWTKNRESDLAGYNVYRTSGGTRTKINTALITAVPQPTYQDASLADGNYLYDVTAVDTHQNESKSSSQANAIVYAPVITQPHTPVGQSSLQIQGTNAAANSAVEMAVEGVAGYELRVTTQSDAEGKFNGAITLTLGENRITARSTDRVGNISKDSRVVIVVYNDTPSAPTGLIAAVQNSDVHLTWNPNPETDLFGYNVYRDGVKLNKSDAVILTQATFIASSSFASQYAPEAAMDALSTTFWMPQDGASTANPVWWEMDLSAPELVSRVSISWGTDFDSVGNEVLYAGKDFEVQVWSADANAWTTQATAIGNAVKDSVFDFNPAYRTDKIRIFITDSTDVNSAKQVRLAEVGMVKDNLIAFATTSLPAYDDLNLPNRQYSYTISAVDNYGFESALSSAATTTVSMAPPSQPAVLAVASVPTGLNASWIYTGSPAAGFNLYRSASTGGPFTKISSSVITGSSFIDINLLVGVTYYYVVTVVDNAGNEGPRSNEASGMLLTSIAPFKPIIFFPTIPGLPVTLFTNATAIYGSAAPGSLVNLADNGRYVGQSTAQLDDTVQNSSLNYDGKGAAISPDGTTLVYSYNGSIWLKALATSAVKKIANVSGRWTFVWSPNSGKIAYTYKYDDYGNYRIGIYDVQAGTNTPLTSDDWVQEDCPTWSPDGNKVVFLTRTGSLGIWLKDLVTGTITQLVSSASIGNLRLSPDGRTLAYHDGNSLSLFDLASGAITVIDDNTDGYEMDWSPDAKALAFVSYRDGTGDVYILDVASGNQVRITNSGESPYYLMWAADGKHLLFDIWDNVNSRDTLWIADTRTQSSPRSVMPDLKNVWYMGSARTGSLAFINQNDAGTYTYYLMSPKGAFSFSAVSLAPGENIFTATATGAAGNTSGPSDAISVTYDTLMMPDLAVTSDDVYLYPPYPIAGERMAVNAVVWNPSQMDISNVDVAVYIWNALNQLELLKSETIPVITAGSSAVVTGTWNSTGKTGDNRLVVVVDPNDVIAESDETNNMAIKDFSVADHVGMSMSTVLDAVQYMSNRNANITVTVRNSGPAANAVLSVQIEDTNGYPVYTFDPKTLNVAYANDMIQNPVWNTGSTYAGSYTVHSVLKDSSAAILAENTIPLTILSDAADDLTVTTDKIGYSPGENVTTSLTIKNAGTNTIIPTLQATITISSATGTALFSDVKTVANLLPGASVALSSLWNTGLNMLGDYQAIATVSSDGGTAVTKSAGFKINTVLFLTGTITPAPQVVPVGNAAQVSYTLTNAGNADAIGYTARITILDPETQTVMQTSDVVLDIAANASRSGQITINTSGYGLKTYAAVLQTLSQGATKNIANTTFAVKDLTPPVISIITPMTNGMYNSAVSISVLASDNASGVDNVEYQRDSGQWQLLPLADTARGRYGATWEPVPADNGSHVISFRATDKAGNTSVPVLVNITIQSQTDATPPTGSIVINNGATYTNNALVTLTLVCTDTESGCSQMQFSSDNAAWFAPEAYAATKAWQVSAGDGPKTVYVKYTDSANNTSSAYSAAITLDTTPPALTLSTLPDGSITNNDTLNIAGTATDNIGLQSVMISNATVTVNANGTFSQALKLVAGSNTITAIATDFAGNTMTDTRTITLDQTAPQITITSPTDNSVASNPSITVSGNTDKTTTVLISLNSGPPVTAATKATTFSLPITLATNTNNTIFVYATDLAGNPSSAKRTVTHDNVSPALAVTNPAQDITTNQASILLQGTVADLTITMVTITNDGNTYTPAVTNGAFEQSLTFSDEKTYAIFVTATDAAGNTSTGQRNVIYDKTSPFLTIDPVKTPTNNPQQVITGTRELNSTLTMSCSTAVVGMVSYPTDTTWQTVLANMTEGTNQFSVVAMDQAGNVSNPPSATIVLDIQAPDTTIQTGPAPLTNQNGANFSFISTEEGFTFECSLDQGNFTPCTNPATYNGLADNVHTFQVRATDQAGNTDQTPAVYIWTIDTVPPIAVIIGAPTSLTNVRSASLTITGNDVIAYQYSLDFGVFSAETSTSTPLLLSGLLDGAHNVLVAGKDSAGNWQRYDFATRATWTVDITPPALIVSTLPDGSYTNNSVLNIVGTASDAHGILSVVLSGQTVTTATPDNINYTFSQAISLATGSNTMTTVATDKAGNTSTDMRTIIFDRTAPVVTITNPADNSLTNKADVDVTGFVDKISTVSIKVNGISTLPDVVTGSTFTFPVTLAYSGNLIEVTAVDVASNPGTAKRSVTLDNLSPALAITSPNQDMGTNLSGITISGTVSDLTAVSLIVTCPTASIDVVSTPTSTTWNVDITNMQQGTNAVTVRATDQVGNSTSVIRNIISSQTPVTIDPVRTPTNNPQQLITGTMELNSTVTVSCSSATMGTVTYPTSTTWQTIIAGMTEGANILIATATDLEGRTSDSVFATIVLDIHAPITTPSPAPGAYYNTVAATLAANEPATIYYTIDGTPPSTASNIYGVPILLTSSTTINFFAVDMATNAEAIKSATYTVITDTAPPVTTLTAGSPNYTSGDGKLYVTSSSLFTLSAIDNLSGVKTIGYRFDSGTWNTYASPFSLITEGSHTVGYRSTDDAANVELEKNLGIIVDNTPPVSTITIGAPPVIVLTAITLTAIDSASGVKLIEYNIDGNSWTIYNGSFTLAVYSQGTHTINYRSTDNVGNVETPKTRTVQLWMDRPTITTTALTDGTVNASYRQTLTATGGTLSYLWSISTGTLPGGLLLNNTTGVISGTPLSAGTATITFQAADANNMTNAKVLSLTIYSPISITTNALASGYAGTSYSQTLAATGGKTPYSWSISSGALPSGLSLITSTGVISGTPTSAGTATFTTQVKDANNSTSSRVLAITINSVLSIPQNLGVFGATGVTMSGGCIDSYDSTQGAYNGVHGSNLSIGTNSIANGAITLSGGVVVYGNAYVGPGGNPAKAITTSGGAVINGTKGALSALKGMTPKSDPGGGTQTTFTNGTTLTSGTYRVSSINLSGSGKVTINGNVTLYVTGSVNLSGSSQIVILPGGSLTVYINGSLNVSGGSMVNQTLNPHNLTIYGTSTCTNVSYSGSSALYGVIYAPAARTALSGGVSVYGSVIGGSVAISGGAAVHYDANLGNVIN